MESQSSVRGSGADPMVGSDSEEGFRHDLQLWRERPLRGLMISMLAACVFAAAWFGATPYGLSTFTQELWVTAALLVGLLLVGNRLPFTVRSSAFLLLVFATCSSSLLHIGINSNAMVGFSTVAIAAAILFRVRVALGSIVVVMLSIVGISALHSAGWIERASNWTQVLDSARLVNAVRVAGIFGLLSSAGVVGVSFLLRRTEHLAWQQARALQALRSEQAERERLQRDLELREAALHKARELETLGRLAGSMAHDFNNALLVIWAALDDLSEGAELSGNQAEALATLRTAAEQAAATTRNLRAFGPLGPGRPGTVSIPTLLVRAAAMFSRILPPNIALQSEVQVDASVAADEGELLRVLTNLALNARDAMRDGGTLTLRARWAASGEASGRAGHANFVAIEVSDTGTGISEEVQQRLFEPFFTTKQAAGTGLGLASVREIVRAAGGDVRISSELERGTTITLFWPAASQAPELTFDGSAAAPGAGRVVLLVDDQAAVRSALAKGLSRAGFNVIEASDASTALESLRRAKLQIDLLCTDWMMPGLPARQLIEEFQRVHGGPVLLCSGYAPAETSIAPELMDGFLAKPFTGQELVRRIQQLLSAEKRAAPPRV